MREYVYVILRNNDRIEGRGPMKLECVFKNFEDAEKRVMRCDGIAGSLQYRDNQLSYGNRWVYNGYEIVKMEVD